MRSIQDIRFEDWDRLTGTAGTVRVVITDDLTQYAARIDYATLLYALEKDLGLEVRE